ncbi:MAG: DUF4430 domain-containing protein [Clostridiales bacterium]|nr:DUF4430 domain-containing protein [Clostridiales bacterium]
MKKTSILTAALTAIMIFTASCAKSPEPSDTGLKCTISIICPELIVNGEVIDALDIEKHELITDDGVILAPTEAAINDGDSVFDVLSRICRENKLHLEYSETPIYGTAYIEGIANLYEFDAGELSGWLYSVDGEYPNYGSSKYSLSGNEVIVWEFTLDANGGQVGEPE